MVAVVAAVFLGEADPAARAAGVSVALSSSAVASCRVSRVVLDRRDPGGGVIGRTGSKYCDWPFRVVRRAAGVEVAVDAAPSLPADAVASGAGVAAGDDSAGDGDCSGVSGESVGFGLSASELAEGEASGAGVDFLCGFFRGVGVGVGVCRAKTRLRRAPNESSSSDVPRA